MAQIKPGLTRGGQPRAAHGVRRAVERALEQVERRPVVDVDSPPAGEPEMLDRLGDAKGNRPYPVGAER